MAKSFQVDTDGTLTTGLAAYWQLESDGTDFWDSESGTVHSVSFGASYGKVNNGAYPSSGGYIGMGNVLNYDYTQALSISAWVYLLGTSGEQWIVAKELSSGTYAGYAFGITSGKLNFQEIANSGGTYFQVQGSTTLSTGTWYHVVLTYDGSGSASGVKFYLNGVAETESTLHDNLAASITTTTAFNLFARTNGVSTLNGYGDEICLHTKVYSSQEIADLYNGGSGQTMVSGGTTYARTAALSMMNASSRSATAQRVWQTARSATATMMNAAARYASVAFHLPVHYARTASVTMMNAASRYATVVSNITVVWVRTASVTMMNAASRLASATKSFIIKIGSTIRWSFFDWD